MNGVRARIIILAVLGVVIVTSAIVGGVSGFRYWDHRQAEDARSSAIEAAERTVTAMFSYEFTTAETELPKAAENLSGSFREDYMKLIEQAIVPGAKEKQLIVRATSQAGGLVSSDRSHAVVMLFLNQVTTSKDSPDSTSTGSRVRVSLDRDGDRWLVSQVTPV